MNKVTFAGLSILEHSLMQSETYMCTVSSVTPHFTSYSFEGPYMHMYITVA